MRQESGGSEGGDAWNRESESGERIWRANRESGAGIRERLRYQRTVEVSKCGQEDF